MAMLKIYTSSYPNGVDIVAPKSFKVDVSDLDSEGTKRTTSGIMQRDRLRARVRQVSIDWGYLTRSQMATLLSHFNCNANFTTSNVIVNDATVASLAVKKGFLVLEYPDPYSSSVNHKRVFYVSDRSVPMFNFSVTAPDGTTGMWESLSLTLIER